MTALLVALVFLVCVVISGLEILDRYRDNLSTSLIVVFGYAVLKLGAFVFSSIFLSLHYLIT